MAYYGYRLFTFRVHRGGKRNALKFNDCDGEHYASIAGRLLKSMSTQTMIGDAPMNDASVATVESEEEGLQKGYKDQPAFRVEEVQVVERTVRAIVLAGRFGSHERALGVGGSEDDADLQDKAACRKYRLVLALPEDGDLGILAVEDISRSCPVTSITRWLRWSSHKEATETPPEEVGQGTSWWRPAVEPLADEERLSEMIKSGQVERLELIKRSITPGRTRESEEYKISAPLVDSGKVSQVAQLVRSWWRRPKAGDHEDPVPTDEQAAQQLAAIVGHKIEDLDIDDGWVVLLDADDKKKRVSPSRMSEVFVYRQPGSAQIDTPSFYAEVRKRASRLQPAADIVMEWPQL